MFYIYIYIHIYIHKPTCILLASAACCLKEWLMFPLASVTQIKERQKQGSAKCCYVDFFFCRKTGCKKTHRKRHFSFDTANVVLPAQGG